MLGHIILISAQVNSQAGVPVLEAVTFGVFSEVQRGTSARRRGVRGVWSGYVGAARRAGRERGAEAAAGRRCEVRLQEQRALADRGRAAASELLELRDEHRRCRRSRPRSSRGDATPDFRTVTIDKGTRDGLQADMAVIAPAGVVGRVVVAGARRGAGAAAHRSQRRGRRDRRAHARRAWSSAAATTAAADGYVSNVADIVVGDIVVTSGIDGIYPEGLRRSAASSGRGERPAVQARSPCGRRSISRASRKCWSC